MLAKVTGTSKSMEEATDMILKVIICLFKLSSSQVVSNEKLAVGQLEPLRDLLLHFCAKYLYEAKRNGFAVNPVGKYIDLCLY